VAKKKLTPDEFQQAIQFSKQLLRTEVWMEKAEELLAAAQLLEEDVIAYWGEVHMKAGRVVSTPRRRSVQGPYSLLVAYAIENYCKALLIYQHRDQLQNRFLLPLPSYLKEHDLLRLARCVQLPDGVPDEELLTRLSRNSIWSARYPVPTGPTGLRAIQRFSNGRKYFLAYFGPKDVTRINRFVRRLSEHVAEKLGNI